MGMLTMQTRKPDQRRPGIYLRPADDLRDTAPTNGFEVNLQDKTGGDINTFFNISQQFIAKLNQRPEIALARQRRSTRSTRSIWSISTWPSVNRPA